MSFRKLQVTCNRCFKHFYGEEDLSCHMMMAHRTSDSLVDATGAVKRCFGSPGYNKKPTSEAQGYIPSTVMSLLCKVDKYFDGITVDILKMKENIATNSAEIWKIREQKQALNNHTEENLSGYNSNGYEGLNFSDDPNFDTSKDIEKNSACMETLAKVISGQKELQEQMLRLNNKIENRPHCYNQGEEHDTSLDSPVGTVRSPQTGINILKKKGSKVIRNDDKSTKLLQQVEKEKERSRQLLGINSQLKAQTKLLRSKLRKKDLQGTEQLDQKINELMMKCDQLSEENISLRKSVKEQEDVNAEYVAAKDAIEEKNKGLMKDLASSESELKETKTRFESLQKQTNLDKDNREQRKAQIQHLKNLVHQMAKEKEGMEDKMKQLLDEVEFCRGDVMKKQILEDELRELQDECKERQEKIDLLNSDLMLNDTKIHSLEKTLKDVRCEKDDLQEKFEMACKEQVRLAQECESLQGEVDSCRKQHQILQSALSETNESKSVVEQDNLALKQSVDAMKTQNCELKDSLTVIEEVKKNLADENTALKQSIADVRKQCDNSAKKLTDIESQKAGIEQELINERKELKETETELQEKISALFYLDEKRSKLDDENERLEELNAELEEEICGYKELLADHDDLMNKHRQRISEIDQYKAEVQQLKQSEKENMENLSVMVREGKRLGEEIAHLQQEKEALEIELDTCRMKQIDENQKVADECKIIDPHQSQVEGIMKELQLLVEKKENVNDDLNVDQMISAIRVELENKNSQIKEMDIATAKLKADAEQLRSNVEEAKKQEQEERYAREEANRKVEQMQVELDEYNRSYKPFRIPNLKSLEPLNSVKVAEAGGKSENREEVTNEGAVCETRPSRDDELADVDDFDIDVPVIALDSSDDELFGRKPQKIDPDDLEADFYDNDPSSCEDENQFKGYLPSRLCRGKEVIPRQTKLAPLTSSVSSWPKVERKSLLGPLPPLAKPGKVPKQPKPEKKKTKKNENKESVTNDTQGKKSKKKKTSKLVEDGNDDLELTNNDISNLLDNL